MGRCLFCLSYMVGSLWPLRTSAQAVPTSAPVAALSRQRAQEILFITPPPSSLCPDGTEAEQISCLIASRYAREPLAAKSAVSLYAQSGTVLGLLPEQDFDGGYRGLLHLVPRLPIGADVRHLHWAIGALVDFEAFFKQLGGAMRYRWRALEFRFFQSVKRRTPSAFASDWTVGYNVAGSLLGSEAGVRGTLFHEIFHLNDQGHGNWSVRVLSPIYEAIVAKCGTEVKCLTPYTPDSIKVRGGTYYDFTPGNGVGEYAADIARRYYTEHRALWKREPAVPAFKCGNSQNAQAWRLVVDEFFGGVDLIPPCPAK